MFILKEAHVSPNVIQIVQEGDCQGILHHIHGRLGDEEQQVHNDTALDDEYAVHDGPEKHPEPLDVFGERIWRMPQHCGEFHGCDLLVVDHVGPVERETEQEEHCHKVLQEIRDSMPSAVIDICPGIKTNFEVFPINVVDCVDDASSGCQQLDDEDKKQTNLHGDVIEEVLAFIPIEQASQSKTPIAVDVSQDWQEVVRLLVRVRKIHHLSVSRVGLLLWL
mmetsp:Transcript_104434/g.185709  ORF Transcript_104434/g.185709 Transcript_104434/m.185709 type:complete len:221 (+) Transcript_104434:626-1288(+)